ncbi:hypothetical protein V8F06_007437 [Rhypophila decipiens]
MEGKPHGPIFSIFMGFFSFFSILCASVGVISAARHHEPHAARRRRVCNEMLLCTVIDLSDVFPPVVYGKDGRWDGIDCTGVAGLHSGGGLFVRFNNFCV